MSREFFHESGPQVFRDDVAATVFRSAAARMFEKSGELKSVVERQLLAGGNITNRHDFHPAFLSIPNRLAIFVASVIDEACGITFDAMRRIDKAVFLNFKKINRKYFTLPVFSLAFGASPFEFFARNQLAAVLRHTGSGRNRR